MQDFCFLWSAKECKTNNQFAKCNKTLYYHDMYICIYNNMDIHDGNGMSDSSIIGVVAP